MSVMAVTRKSTIVLLHINTNMIHALQTENTAENSAILIQESI